MDVKVLLRRWRTRIAGLRAEIAQLLSDAQSQRSPGTPPLMTAAQRTELLRVTAIFDQQRATIDDMLAGRLPLTTTIPLLPELRP
jgi:hypothetical protein